MTMSRNSSESSLDEHHHRETIDFAVSETPASHIPDDGSDMPSLASYRQDDLTVTSSMPSLHSFRLDDMTAASSVCENSLPSLRSFRIDDFSMSSSIHNSESGAGSVEGWGSINSIGASADGDSSDYTPHSHSPSSPIPPLVVERTERLPMPTRCRSPFPENRTFEQIRPRIDLISNARPPLRLPPADQRSEDLPTRPLRNTSPQRRTERLLDRAGSSEVSSIASTDESSTSLRQMNHSMKVPSSVGTSVGRQGSNSSLRGGDSLPRLPRRTKEDRRQAAEQSDSDSERDEPLESRRATAEDETASKDNPPTRNRTSPTSVRALQQAIPSKPNPEESATAATEVDADESEEGGEKPKDKDKEKKRGKLRTFVSNSFRSINRASSFTTGSFRSLRKRRARKGD